jgi:molybdopterin molybdotransferase
MVSPSDAARRVVAGVTPLPTERRPLDAARDLILAADISSPIDLPPWDNSAMDGYAVRSADITAPGVTLRIEDVIPAGATPARPITPGGCARIFTGAPLPPGADSVIRQEDVTALDGAIRVNDTRDAGRNVRPRGEDLRRGAVALVKGTVLEAAQLGLLAAIAEREVPVHRRPRVALLTSGDELADLDQREAILAGRKIASSNSYALRAMVRAAGGDVVDLGIARDDPDDVRRRLEAGARTADLVVTSAGVSVGEHDYLRGALDQLGGTLVFWRVTMRPGGTTAFGTIGNVPWLGLPGNPVSTIVTFELFARPLMRAMLGHTRLFRRAVNVRLDEPARAGHGLRHYLRAVVEHGSGELHARLAGAQGSAILSSMAVANALLIVPEDRSEVAAGEMLKAIMLDEPVHLLQPEY